LFDQTDQAELLGERLPRDRLGRVLVDPRHQRVEDLRRIALGRDHHHPHLLVRSLGAHLVHERHAVHPRHRPIDQDDVDRSELGQP